MFSIPQKQQICFDMVFGPIIMIAQDSTDVGFKNHIKAMSKYRVS